MLVSELSNIAQQLDGSVFQHPTPLKIFLYAKRQKDSVGLREIQRKFGIKNISTVAWHVDKLVDAGFFERTKSNRYVLSSEASRLSDLELPVKYPVKILYGILLPRFSFFLGFGLAGFIIYVYLLFNARNPLTKDFVGLILLSFLIIGNLLHWIKYKKEIDSIYRDNE